MLSAFDKKLLNLLQTNNQVAIFKTPMSHVRNLMILLVIN